MQQSKPAGLRVNVGCNGFADYTDVELEYLLCFRNPPGMMGNLYKDDQAESTVKPWEDTADWRKRY